ncbi:glycosyltransferase family 2 protein [Mucilaginibacter rubeus]|uniref:Glycosyltransferase family 2 protein n=1 Tax=Mucilaginibacter rubeus TaxID=2027860 RepID=A0AAE6MLW2_9SPHI|nr:glycosyltransferase family 2 protein [Mucilaginibacter rubeus]QEM20661.1 glycosyltransferase family 2 protein [Mucilaginibacter gossypii]QTE47089.1 glycosyltransferase family 2 protein [Mucilaginibacter rubeus]QTE53690.1 glycosyltransferase family 2 protein [Mucilaginibacter rubeus]QTE60190.1 glycosyltransferase family 2 protein [Mucilaginibacter rubeus]
MNISLLIPTLNAGEIWPQVLQSVNDQNIELADKIIVDSGSTDNTVAVGQQFGFKVININKSEFNHGGTRQLLVNAVPNADICIFITQDAILASPQSLTNIVNVFNDPEIGMAYGRQLPHKNAQILESHARLYNYPDESHVRAPDDIVKMGFKVFFCSNSFSAYRRDALLAIGGFSSDSIMGEDAIVAAKMLIAGYKKAYVADATAHHSHTYTLLQEFRRYFDTRVFHEQNKWLIDDFGKPTGEGIKFMKAELSYVVKHKKSRIFKSVFSLGAKWLGYKTGKFYKKLPTPVLKKLSMHSYYWK